MLALYFIRIAWGIWWIGSLFLLGFSLSTLVFGQSPRPLNAFGKNLLVAALWPFMALSPAGRTKISETMKGTI